MPQDQPPFEITEDFPTPIVRDFEAFLDAVGQPSAFLTKARQALDRATLYALNSQMRTFQSDAHPRTDQHFYPLLHLFQRICLAARLHRLSEEKGKLRMVPAEGLAALRALRPAEKYLALLEALWVDCDWEDILSSMHLFNEIGLEILVEAFEPLAAGQEVAAQKPAHWRRFYSAFRMPEVIQVFSFFGFLNYTPGSLDYQYRKGQFTIQTLTLSPLGKAFLMVLRTDRPFQLWNLPTRRQRGAEPTRFPGQALEGKEGGVTEPTPFHAAFLPLLAPDSVWAGLPRAKRKRGKRTFVFRVSYGKSWRTIALSSKHSLDDLHRAIQRAFRFDNDHLYAFYMDAKRHSRNAYHDPRGSDMTPFADQATIGELGLYLGQRFLYFFDFGDSWEFGVELLEIRDEPHKGAPKILQKVGRSPEQYSRDGW